MDTVLLALRVLVSLGVVVGLLWFVQRRSLRWTAKRKSSSPIQVIARKSLGSKANLVIVDVDEIRFVLGVTEHGVSVIQSADAPVEAAGFAEVLARQEPLEVPDGVAVSGTAGSAPEASAPAAFSAAPGKTVARPALPFLARTPASALQPDFRGFTGSIISLETWKQAAKSLRGQRWPH